MKIFKPLFLDKFTDEEYRFMLFNLDKPKLLKEYFNEEKYNFLYDKLLSKCQN